MLAHLKILGLQKYDLTGEQTSFLVFPIRAEAQRQLFERTALRISNKIRTSALVKLAPRKLSVLTEEIKTLRNSAVHSSKAE